MNGSATSLLLKGFIEFRKTNLLYRVVLGSEVNLYQENNGIQVRGGGGK